MTGRNIQSMQEIMLEFIVMNYREVFASLLEDDEGSCISRKKMLPPILFQKIIYKSEEMKWCMDIIHMQKLMTFRDVLSWKNINFILYPTREIIIDDILEKMSQVEYPLKTLSICVGNLSEKRMSELCLMGSTIECLDLKYNSRYPINELLKGHFPNLRKLSLEKMYRDERDDNLYIDLSRFSDTLEELKLENENLDDRLTRSIVCLKKLKVLSLPNSSANYLQFYKILCAMNNLRTLDIRNLKDRNTIPNTCVTPSKLLSVISKMPNLENLETSLQTFTEKQILETVKCRKWKKFGFYDMGANAFQSSYDKFKLFADQVFGLFKETMLSTYEIYAQDDIYGDIISSKVLTFLPYIPQEQIVRVENIILNMYAGDICYYSYLALEYIKTGRCTDDFITDLTSEDCSQILSQVLPLLVKCWRLWRKI